MKRKQKYKKHRHIAIQPQLNTHIVVHNYNILSQQNNCNLTNGNANTQNGTTSTTHDNKDKPRLLIRLIIWIKDIINIFLFNKYTKS